MDQILLLTLVAILASPSESYNNIMNRSRFLSMSTGSKKKVSI